MYCLRHGLDFGKDIIQWIWRSVSVKYRTKLSISRTKHAFVQVFIDFTKAFNMVSKQDL